jgi:hypothetical protein
MAKKGRSAGYIQKPETIKKIIATRKINRAWMGPHPSKRKEECSGLDQVSGDADYHLVRPTRIQPKFIEPGEW